MLEVQWEYLKDNIGIEDYPVASLHKKWYPANIILLVYEACDHYYTIHVQDIFSFIKPIRVPYDSASAKLKEKYGKEKIDSLSCNDFQSLLLEEGCKIIEEDFMNQAETILQLLS